MGRFSRLSATAVAALSLAACKHHVDAAYFGKHVQPPHGLAALRPGMTMKEARAAVPGITKDGDVSSGVTDLKLEIDEDHGRVEDITAIHHGGFDKLLTAAWGAPVTEPHERDVDAAWEDATTGWRAELSSSVLHFYRLMTPAYFGTAGHPFGVFAKLAPTATYAEANALARNSEDVTAGHHTVIVTPRDKSLGALGEIVVMGLSAREKDVLLAAWGPGLATHGHGDDAGYLAAWLAPDGWRAFLKQDNDDYDVEISPYLTDVRLFGDGPGLAALPKPVIGKTVAELHGEYPDLGPARDDAASLDIPPDAWGSLFDSVLFDFDNGKVSRAMIALRYDLHPERAAELKALFAKKWGAPKPDASLRDLAKSGDPPLAYPATAELVPVVEDSGNGTLFLELRAPAPAASTAPAKKKTKR